MEKLSSLKDNLLELAFIAICLRLVIVGASIGDAIALVSIVLSISYSKFAALSKVKESDEINKKIDHLSGQVQSLQLGQGMKRTVSLNEPRR